MSNLQILILLKDYFEKNPDKRFIQGLWETKIFEKQKDAYGLEFMPEKYYEDSELTLSKLHKVIVEVT